VKLLDADGKVVIGAMMLADAWMKRPITAMKVVIGQLLPVILELRRRTDQCSL
jgi:hypothetical protein